MKVKPNELKALGRFRECCEDSDAGGHDVPKEMMQRLAAVGLVRTLGFGRYETTEFGDWVMAQPPSAPVQDVATAMPKRLTTDESREYLVEFMAQHFTDKTYHRYIRGDGGRNALAGDFALQMARALRMLHGKAQGITKDAEILLSVGDWHEDMRDCLFFHFNSFEEAPEVYVGSPNEVAPPFDHDYWTHFVQFNFNPIFDVAIAASKTGA